MRALSSSELLDVWEDGLARSPAEQALLLLARAYPEVSPEDLEAMHIGRRDGCLLMLREKIYGTEIACTAICPSCGERLETAFCSKSIEIEENAKPSSAFSLSLDGYDIRFRLPSSLDLFAIDACQDIPSAKRLLVDRCVLEVHDRNGCSPTEQLPSSIIDAVSKKMGELDPQADLRIAFVCPVCNHKWHQIFDIVSFFWSEIDAWARRTLHDVHILASSYGWSEAGILAMSQQRRQMYLELVGA